MILLKTVISWRSVQRIIEKQKEFGGILTAFDSNSVTIDEDGTERTFEKKDMALIRQAIEF